MARRFALMARAELTTAATPIAIKAIFARFINGAFRVKEEHIFLYSCSG
jgi:hypothetical protein